MKPHDFPAHPVLEDHFGPLDSTEPWQKLANEQTRWWNSLKEPEKKALFEQEMRKRRQDLNNSLKSYSETDAHENRRKVSAEELPDLP
jgi:hypothetical protein